MDFIAGGLAGAGATIVSNPMDVIKTRLQLQGELKSKAEQITRYKGFLHAVYVIGKTDGILALQKGLIAAMIYGFAMNSIRLGIYRFAEVHKWTKSKNGDIALHKAMLWSGVGGSLGAFVGNPASVIKTRIQASAHPSIAVGRQHVYKGVIDGFKTVYRTEGIKGYFAGADSACIRMAVGSAAQLTTFSKAKEWLVSRGVCTGSPIQLAFWASAISGVALAIMMCPFDVITVRLFNQGSAGGQHKLLYTSFYDCVFKIYSVEGLRGFYKGFGPLYLRIAPHTTFTLVIWDVLNNIFLLNKKR